MRVHQSSSLTSDVEPELLFWVLTRILLFSFDVMIAVWLLNRDGAA